ncbi:MAG: Rho termination factor N-terminal domain-containing protein, partial [Microcystaceae cyanobacterium]
HDLCSLATAKRKIAESNKLNEPMSLAHLSQIASIGSGTEEERRHLDDKTHRELQAIAKPLGIKRADHLPKTQLIEEIEEIEEAEKKAKLVATKDRGIRASDHDYEYFVSQTKKYKLSQKEMFREYSQSLRTQ